MANVVTADVTIPAKIHNTMIGSGGKLIQSVMDDCGGVSIKFPPPESKSDKVTVRGPKDDVEKAKKMLAELANEKQLSSMTCEVRAKPEHHKFLIGRHGSNVQAIRDKTGARIIFPGEKDSDREIITIVGTKEAVAAARLELENKIKGLDNVVEDTMTVDPKHHRYFVARRGEVLRHIGDEFGGAIVSFPRSGVSSDKVTLKGAKNCVEAARNRISEIVQDLDCQVTIECEIDQQYHRTVMGPRGTKLQKICADFNVQIKIPERNRQQQQQQNGGDGDGAAVTDNNNNNTIRITGNKERCDEAAAALRSLVPISIEMNVPFEYHRYIIGKSGAGTRQIMEDYDVNINVPKIELESSIITITGTNDNVEKAKADLEEKVKDLEAKSFEVKVEVNPEYHRKIIGRKGETIGKLRMNHSVEVHLPKKGEADENIITIRGYEDNVIKAKEEIEAIVHQFESMVREEVSIDSRTHPMIIGRRGQGIRKIMQDFKVDIKMPKQGVDADPDLVIIMGAEEAVEDCKEHLLLRQEEFMQDVEDKEWMASYTRGPDSRDRDQKKSGAGNTNGFQVGKGAPWQGASDEAFPSLGGDAGPAPGATLAPAWGPRGSRR